ncbi:hypothetical protein [Sorangium sp. So ce233]|uniref:hypothetical protein n=1 Tax=Sorangium sp. So ce233 TaxID=3133290 RepID=UPI003F5DB1CB
MVQQGREYATKLMVAAASDSNALVVDVSGEAAEDEAAENGPDLDDWGLEKPDGYGLWVWEGAIGYPYEDGTGEGYELDFSGEWRRATPEEAARFAAGEPVWPEPATSEASSS